LLCLASFFKGAEFLRECRRLGARVFLITKEKWRGEDWPHDALEGFVTVPDDASTDYYVHAAAEIARRHRLRGVVALEEYDVVTAGLVREHLRVAGMSSSEARLFRDKLAMRAAARDAHIRVPEFVHALNYQEIGEYTARVPAPWVMKPRTDVSAIGIRKLHTAEEVWRHLDELDARPRPQERVGFHLLERFVAGEVFHVDSIVSGGEVKFAGVSRYGRPPMDVAHEGGVFVSQTIAYDSDERGELLEANRRVVRALGLRRGAAHAEFIRGAEDGELYFLEVAARVGGAFIAETLEAATGVNVWREWARLELAADSPPYEPPAPRREHAGIILSLSRQEWPDTSGYDDPEIALRPRKRYHAALVVRSPSHARVLELLEAYARRFAADFIAVAPPLERAE